MEIQLIPKRREPLRTAELHKGFSLRIFAPLRIFALQFLYGYYAESRQEPQSYAKVLKLIYHSSYSGF